MKILLGILLVITTIFNFQPVFSAGHVEEARAVFSEMVTAAKASNLDKFKSHILPRDLAEMEKEGVTRMIMMMMVEDDPAVFQAEETEGYILFTQEIKEEGPDSSMTMRREVYMIKHEGHWKFGTPQ
jgi:hypothetical protein